MVPFPSMGCLSVACCNLVVKGIVVGPVSAQKAVAAAHAGLATQQCSPEGTGALGQRRPCWGSESRAASYLVFTDVGLKT